MLVCLCDWLVRPLFLYHLSLLQTRYRTSLGWDIMERDVDGWYSMVSIEDDDGVVVVIVDITKNNKEVAKARVMFNDQ